MNKYFIKKIQNGFILIYVYKKNNKLEVIEWIVKPKTFKTNSYLTNEFKLSGKEISEEIFSYLYVIINKRLKFTTRKLVT